MPFVYELISEDEKKRINFDQLTSTIGWRPRPSGWCIDRDQHSFLIITFWGSEDVRNHQRFVFHWENCVFAIHATTSEHLEDGAVVHSWWMTNRPHFPAQLMHRREEMYESLKAAVTCYKNRSGISQLRFPAPPPDVLRASLASPGSETQQ